MARGPRRTVDDHIAIIDAQIAKVQSKIDDLVAKREVLESRKREEALGKLYDMIQDSGRSIDDVKEILIKK